MKYTTPQLKTAGPASQLIQTKVEPGTDKTSAKSRDAMAPALEQ